MIFLGVYVANTTRNAGLNQITTQLQNDAYLVAELCRTYISGTPQQSELDNIAKTSGAQINNRITIIAKDGTVLGDTDQDPLLMENHSSRTEVIQALADGIGQSTRYSITDKKDMMYVAVTIKDNDNIVGIARVSLPLTQINNSVNNAVATIIVVTVLSGIVVIVAAAIITRMITRPVRRITRAAEQITTGRIRQMIQIDTDDEIGRLSHAFNEMSTGLKNTMDNLEEEQDKIVTVLSGITDGVIMLDPNRNVILANPAAEKLFDFNFNSTRGQPLIEAVKDHEVDELSEKSLSGNRQHTAQLYSVKSNFLRVIASPLTINKMTGVLLLFQDLTEMRSLQTMRREFIGNVSHEIRTPLAGIRAIVDTLREGAINDRQATINFLTRLDIEVDRITQLINELIELSRIESGKAQLRLESFGINKLAEEILARLNPQAERKNISIIRKLNHSLPEIKADRERISQVITNILHNAIKFTPDGGRITVSTAHDENNITLHIEDTGIGISAEDLPHIFERFFKADKSRSTSGTGLGLAISKHIIQTHGGKIWVESDSGKGSVFSFSLPLKTDYSS